MSHEATNWAIKQRGLKPAVKILLWHLADCHNPSHGCFPSQEYLAEHCEMTSRTIRTHLEELERIGLIRREKVRASGQFDRTEYTLFLDVFLPPPEKSSDGKSASSPPENSRRHHRKNFPTNPVREPLREPVISAQGELLPKQERPKRKSRLPDWAEISDGMRRAAEKRSISQQEAEAQFQRFKNDALAKGKSFVDWDRAFVTWLDSPYYRPITSVPNNSGFQRGPNDKPTSKSETRMQAFISGARGAS